MEEKKKKRKGYKSQNQQTNATTRYRNTEKGKERTIRTNLKSNCKKFIKEFATVEELEELKELIILKRKGGIKMDYVKKVNELFESGKEVVYLLIGAKIQIKKSDRKYIDSNFESLCDGVNTDILGVFDTEEEAKKNFTCNIRKFGSGITSFIEFETARVIWVLKENLENIEEINFLNDGSEFLGIEELKEFIKKK